MSTFRVTLAFLCCFLLTTSFAMSRVRRDGSARTLGSLFGFGYTCNGCPPHFCDDDPAIVLGYCCGCAAFYEYLPVKCSTSLRCPLNTYELCQRYDYMMHCCCGR